MTRMPPVARVHRAVLGLMLPLLFLVSCTIRLISPYDEKIDTGTTDLHTKIVAFVGKMDGLAGKAEGTYASNKQFYTDTQADISSLRLRAALTPKNDITVKLLDEIAGNLDRLRALHEGAGDKGLAAILGKPALGAIDVNCESILKLEIAKKRGDD